MSLFVTTALLPHSNDTELIMYGHYYIRGKQNTKSQSTLIKTTMMPDMRCWTPCCHPSRHHVMSEVLLLLLPTESLKLRPDPSVDIWVRSTVSGQGDQPIMCCPLLPPLTRILRALSQTKTCIMASTPSAGGMKDAVYSSIPSQKRGKREIASGVGKVNKKLMGFPRLF